MAEHTPHCADLQKKYLHHECPEHGLSIFFMMKPCLLYFCELLTKTKILNFLLRAHSLNQLGYMNRPIGYDIPPHDHNPVSRKVEWTQETLIYPFGARPT